MNWDAILGMGALALMLISQFGWVRQARETERIRCQNLLLEEGLSGRLDARTALATCALLEPRSSPRDVEGGGR